MGNLSALVATQLSKTLIIEQATLKTTVTGINIYDNKKKHNALSQKTGNQ